MNPTTRTFSTLAFLALPATAWAQVSLPASPGWTAGAGIALIDSPYAGEGSRARPFPLVNFNGERFFLDGISGGVHLYASDRFAFDAVLSARLYGFDISDLGRVELQANGLDPVLLSDRDDGVDAGLRATYRTSSGALSLEGLHDVSGASEGYEVSLEYRHTRLFNRAAVTANIGASWMSSELAGYYFGILDEEVSRGLAEYSPGSVVIPRIGLSLAHPIGSSKWQLLGSVEYQFLPSELRSSPLLEPDSDRMGRLALGFIRSF